MIAIAGLPEARGRRSPTIHVYPFGYAFDETELDRDIAGCKDDRYGRGCGLGRERGTGVPDEEGDLTAQQFVHEHRQAIDATCGSGNPDILVLDEAVSFRPWPNAATMGVACATAPLRTNSTQRRLCRRGA
jgi:hypothetical protein